MSRRSIGRYLVERFFHHHGDAKATADRRKPNIEYVKSEIVSLTTVYTQTSENEREYQKQNYKGQWLANLLLFFTLLASLGSVYFSDQASYYSGQAAYQAKRQADAADAALKEANQPLIATSGVRWASGLVKDTEAIITLT